MIRRQRGFTLIELLVVIAIILILAAILFPVFAKVRAKAIQTACASNLKQLGIASEMYQGAWGDVLVPYGAPFAWGNQGNMWPELLDPFLKQIANSTNGKLDTATTGQNLGKLYRCAAATEEEESGWAGSRSYGMNTYLGGWQPGNTPVVVPVSKAKYPSQTVRIAESEMKTVGGGAGGSFLAPYPHLSSGNHKFAPRHNGVGEVLWVDGHVSSMTFDRYNLRDNAGAPNHYGNVWLRPEGPKPQP
jgi:prepilin-type N-terminal cleavage/methylation domain-containing protein/prepilin-type processing-associated H-X9-DG protein